MPPVPLEEVQLHMTGRKVVQVRVRVRVLGTWMQMGMAMEMASRSRSSRLAWSQTCWQGHPLLRQLDTALAAVQLWAGPSLSMCRSHPRSQHRRGVFRRLFLPQLRRGHGLPLHRCRQRQRTGPRLHLLPQMPMLPLLLLGRCSHSALWTTLLRSGISVQHRLQRQPQGGAAGAVRTQRRSARIMNRPLQLLPAYGEADRVLRAWLVVESREARQAHAFGFSIGFSTKALSRMQAGSEKSPSHLRQYWRDSLIQSRLAVVGARKVLVDLH